jgi:transposase-like protein
MDTGIERNIKQGYITANQVTQIPGLGVEDIAKLEAIEPCAHPKDRIRVLVIVEECADCGRQFHHRIVSPNQRLQAAIVQVHQGLIDAETVIAAGNYTEEEQAQLRAAWEGKCEHEQVEEYECSCSQKMRYRCKSCARVWEKNPRG